MLSFSHVSAVIVTRGNTDLTPVLDSLSHFDEIIVWDNSVEENVMTYGRVLACDRVRHGIVYSQDDDIIHTTKNQHRILNAFQRNVLTGCMWAEWSNGAKAQGIPNGYDDLVFAGSGSVYSCGVTAAAADRYLAHYPLDDFFLLWADTIIGVLAPTQQLSIRFKSLPEAEAPDRMCNLPNAVQHKAEAIRRAREIRDRKLSGRELRLRETEARLERTPA